MKRALLMVPLLLVLMLTYGCQSVSVPNEPPDIQVIAGAKEINWGWTILKWDSQEPPSANPLKDFVTDDSIKEAPYIEIGKIIDVAFSSNPPESITVTETLLDEQGNLKYTEKETVEIPVELNNGNFSITIADHPASALNSFYEDNKKDLRGYRMTATWGDNVCQYVFIIKTDAVLSSIKANRDTLTIEKLIELSKMGDRLSWGDFAAFYGNEIGSGLYIIEYPIDDTFSVLIGGASPDEEPMYILLKSIDANNIEKSLDVRKGDIKDFIKESQ